ncbi:hypothetical protein [Kordia jejudonensis]|uniref:hypothetical protein n=1 Tax=Kordia jejudonensis TaxID=1348245 RepID=UPI00062977C6|nr:hypothetical protein [Kordia jejudonensis]
MCSIYLLASTPKTTDNKLEGSITSTVTANDSDASGVLTNVLDDESTLKGSLNSILSYSIFIFFAVLIIILIDNRNLEKRYKRLVSDFKNKDPLL